MGQQVNGEETAEHLSRSRLPAVLPAGTPVFMGFLRARSTAGSLLCVDRRTRIKGFSVEMGSQTGSEQRKQWIDFFSRRSLTLCLP
jgi:hypothetical protein